MYIITVPVSAFAKNVLHVTFGDPVVIPKFHSLNKALLTVVRYGSFVPTAYTDSVTLACSASVAASIEYNRNHAGQILDHFAKEQMLQFVWNLYISGIDAYKALRIFYANNRADDSGDYDIESAYRLWQRHRSSNERAQKKPSKPLAKTDLTVRPNAKELGSSILRTVPVSFQRVETIAAHIARQCAEEAYRLPIYAHWQIRAYLLITGGHTAVSLVGHFGRSRNAIGNAVAKIKGWVAYDEQFGAIMATAIRAAS